MTSSDNACFAPIHIGPRVASNRFVIQPMEFNDAVGADDMPNRGNPTPRTFARYRNLFEGNAGMIVLEAISVGDTSMARKDQLTILPRNVKPLTRFVGDLKAINPKPVFVAQLTHSGEISGAFSTRVSPKPMIGFDAHTLTDEEADQIIDQFVEAAKIAYDVGFDGLDLKFCHGYLGAQILRPYNDRKWKYGGPKENRFRFGYEIYERIRKAVSDPNFILGSKITLYEGIPGGQGTAGPESPMMDLSEPLEFIRGIEERGASFILQSAGGPAGNTVLNEPPQNTPDEAYLHFYFSNEVKKVVKPETVVIGSAYTVFANGENNLRYVDERKNNLLWWADKNIRNGVTDMVALGRQSISDPQFPKKLIEGRPEDVKWCTACDGCFELLARQQKVGCVTFDREATQTLAKTRREFGPLTVSRT